MIGLANKGLRGFRAAIDLGYLGSKDALVSPDVSKKTRFFKGYIWASNVSANSLTIARKQLG